MTNIAVLENKISALKKYLKILTAYKKYAQQELEHDLNLRGAVERYLYLAAQTAIDLAEAVIAYKGFRKPTTMSEAFFILQEEGIIGQDVADAMAKMTGFRNIIAHDYERLDYGIVYDVLQNRISDIENFLDTVSRALRL